MRAAAAGARRTSRFDFARAYQHPDSRMQPVNVLRQRFSVEALTGKPCPAEGMPFVVRPAAPVTVEKLMAMLANHYEGAPEDVRVGAEGRRTAASIPASATAAPWSRPCLTCTIIRA